VPVEDFDNEEEVIADLEQAIKIVSASIQKRFVVCISKRARNYRDGC
jgi:hypothetical protein